MIYMIHRFERHILISVSRLLVGYKRRPISCTVATSVWLNGRSIKNTSVSPGCNFNTAMSTKISSKALAIVPPLSSVYPELIVDPWPLRDFNRLYLYPITS